ncbi:hypothetical protein VCR4J2_280004 [Vibrio coralliirubri]|nr:hypothetical protein VCR4J2_280004 [Vibrio coralliirubri]
MFKSRDDGSYSIDKESIKSDVIDPDKLPNYPLNGIADFD